MRVILVPTADRPEGVLSLDTAFALAKRLDANVVGCHVRAERREPSSRNVSLTPEIAYGATTDFAPNVRMTSLSARKVYEKAASRHGFVVVKRASIGKRQRAYWHELVGTPARMFGIVGPIADLAILSRPRPTSAGRARAFLLAALLHSARPVLVVPQRPLAPVGKRILVAWNQSTDAAWAVAASMPLLQRAEQIVVATCGPENRTGPKSTHLAQYLANWDIAIERVHTKGRHVEKELEAVYRETRSDVLLMGAYSRHRLRQLVFGGVTEHMLFKTEIPVLMLHR